MIRMQYSIGEISSQIDGRAGRRLSLTLWLPAIAIGLWCLPATAAPPSNGSNRTQSLDELLNTDTSSSQLSGARDARSYGAQQILVDAQLAHQLETNSADSDADLSPSRIGAKKGHHVHPVVIGLVAFGALSVLCAAVLLIWSRIVHYREMRDAPLPMAFNSPRT